MDARTDIVQSVRQMFKEPGDYVMQVVPGSRAYIVLRIHEILLAGNAQYIFDPDTDKFRFGESTCTIQEE